MRKRIVPQPLKLESSILQTQQIPIPKLNRQMDDNKKFLTEILKYSNKSIPLPDYIMSSSIEDSLKGLNTRLANIAATKQILADYEKHFSGLNIFFERLINQGKRLAHDEEVIWRMFFLNNTSIIAFNNGDYTTSLELLRKIMQEYNKRQTKHPIFSVAITNLSAIYFKMKDKNKCFEYLQRSYEYSKKMVDATVEASLASPQYQRQLSYLLTIQCIMMVKNRQSVETSTHNIKQIQKLILKLIKQTTKTSKNSLNIPYINRYLEQKKFLELRQVQSSVAGSQSSSKRSRLRSYRLDSINYSTNQDVSGFRQQTLNTQIFSPAKKFPYLKMKQQMNSINLKMTKLQLKTNNIQETLNQVLNILKSNNQNQAVFKRTQVSPKRTIPPVIPKHIFKTLQIQITFYDQGITLRTFTDQQQKLSWGELENIFKLLDLFYIYFEYLQLNPTRHTIAWVISKYIETHNGIKIKKEPSHIVMFEHGGYWYRLFHIRQREFTIYGVGIPTIVFEMCQKSFNYYFQVLKIDEYEAECMEYFSEKQQSSIKNSYSLEVIQVKVNGTFQQDILQVFGNLKIVLQQTANIPTSFKKVKLWFDQTTDACHFLGAYYLLFQNDQLQQIQTKLYPLNKYQGISITDPIIKLYPFHDLQTRFSFSINKTSQLQLKFLFVNLVQLLSIRIQAIKRQGKTKYVIHSTNISHQCVYFQQRMILKKYYRPLFIYVLRTKNRYVSIRFSYYDESQLLTSNISVVFNSYIRKKDDLESLNKKFSKIKQKVKTSYLAKQFGQIESGLLTKKYLHIEEFIEMIEAAEKNWG